VVVRAATAAATEVATASRPNDVRPDGRPDHGAASARTEELYRDHGRLVGGLCRALLRDRAEAEDATQQVFLAAHRSLLNGTSPREPAAWLATIARNECWGRIRTRMREPLPTAEIEGERSVSDPLAEAIRNTDLAAMWSAIAALPRQQRDALLLREFGPELLQFRHGVDENTEMLIAVTHHDLGALPQVDVTGATNRYREPVWESQRLDLTPPEELSVELEHLRPILVRQRSFRHAHRDMAQPGQHRPHPSRSAIQQPILAALAPVPAKTIALQGGRGPWACLGRCGSPWGPALPRCRAQIAGSALSVDCWLPRPSVRLWREHGQA
jgi:RNA polymerase sigma-70 factor (ECF subfamily)